MTDMTEERAKEIYDIDGACMSFEGWQAKGFLAGIEYEREAAKGLVETVHFIGQTIHQAYHETGTYKECSKNTCDAATQALAAYKARTEGK